MAEDMYLVVVLTARNITMADAPKNRKRIMAFQKRYNGYGEMKSWLEDLEKRRRGGTENTKTRCGGFPPPPPVIFGLGTRWCTSKSGGNQVHQPLLRFQLLKFIAIGKAYSFFSPAALSSMAPGTSIQMLRASTTFHPSAMLPKPSATSSPASMTRLGLDCMAVAGCCGPMGNSFLRWPIYLPGMQGFEDHADQHGGWQSESRQLIAGNGRCNSFTQMGNSFGMRVQAAFPFLTSTTAPSICTGSSLNPQTIFDACKQPSV